MFNNIHQLDKQQLNDLDQLRLRCKKENGSTPNLYAHILAQIRTLPACLLYYENHMLMAFLSAFFFYDDAVELSLMVDPTARRRGLAAELIRSIIPLLKQYDYHKLIFSSPHTLNDHWLKSTGFSYTHSEYYMRREDLNPILEFKNTLKFKTATQNDIDVLYELDEACFHKKQSEAPDRFHNLIDNRDYHIVIALKDDKPIGKAHMRWEQQGASLSDIAIHPSLQGKGYGTALIAHCINYSLSEGKPHLSLDVETHNQKALQLYIRLGFTVHNACDYWTISLEQLESKLNEIPIKSF